MRKLHPTAYRCTCQGAAPACMEPRDSTVYRHCLIRERSRSTAKRRPRRCQALHNQTESCELQKTPNVTRIYLQWQACFILTGSPTAKSSVGGRRGVPHRLPNLGLKARSQAPEFNPRCHQEAQGCENEAFVREGQASQATERGPRLMRARSLLSLL